MIVGPPSWKEKVVGYAKKFRGTMLRKVLLPTDSPLLPVLIFVDANRGSLELRSMETRSSKVYAVPSGQKINSPI